jgi:curved DNA-binding protein CbpA
LKDYYQLLEVESVATQQQIRKAYYKLAQQYHPDKSADPQHHDHFLNINEAYQILGDKAKREIYHYRWLQFKNPPKPSTGVPKQPTRPAQAPRPASRQPDYAPPQYRAHYQNYSANAFKEYEKVLRQVCLISLVLAGIFFLDLLFTQTYPNEIITNFGDPVAKNGEGYIKLFTTHTSFWLRFSDLRELQLYYGDRIGIRQTPVLHQILAINPEGFWLDINRGSLYHNFFTLLLAQTALGIAGLYKPFSWPARMNIGILAGIITALNLIILFLSY